MALVGCSSLQATFDEWEIWRKMKFTDPPISARWTRQSNGLAGTSALFSALIYFVGWLVSSIQAGSIAVLIHCIEDLNLIRTWQIDIRKMTRQSTNSEESTILDIPTIVSDGNIW